MAETGQRQLTFAPGERPVTHIPKVQTPPHPPQFTRLKSRWLVVEDGVVLERYDRHDDATNARDRLREEGHPIARLVPDPTPGNMKEKP